MPLLPDIIAKAMQGQKKAGLGGQYGSTIGGFGKEMGFSDNYAQQIKDALDSAYANQLQTATQSASESAVAGGDFNPELSKYYATQGARGAMTQGKIAGLQAGRNDEFNLANLMRGAFNDKISQDTLDFQKKQWEDQQPGVLDDIFAGLSIASNFVPGLAKGGKVKDVVKNAMKHPNKLGAGAKKRAKLDPNDKAHVVMSEFERGTLHSGSGDIVKDRKQAIAIALSEARKHGAHIPKKAGGGEIKDSGYFQAMYNGGIPASEINSSTEPTGDNTLIKAQDGEIIQSRPAVNIAGSDNLELINEGGKMANSIFGGLASKLGAMAQSPQQNSMAGDISNITQNVMPKIKGMFGGASGGGTSAPAKAGYEGQNSLGYFMKPHVTVPVGEGKPLYQEGGQVDPLEELQARFDAKSIELTEYRKRASGRNPQEERALYDELIQLGSQLQQEKQKRALEQRSPEQPVEGETMQPINFGKPGEGGANKIREIKITEKPIM